MSWLNSFPVGLVVGIVIAPVVYELAIVGINYVLGKLPPRRRI